MHAARQRPSMETPKHRSARGWHFPPRKTATPSTSAFVMKPRSCRLGHPAPQAPQDGHGSASAAFFPEAGLKPVVDGIRNVPPFGSPKGEGQQEQTRRSGGVARSQVDPLQGGTGAGVHRHRCWRNRCPLRVPECMDGPASPTSIPPPTDLREVRLNGFLEALAGVRRHGIGGGRHRVPDAAPTGFSDARFVLQPAYSLWPHSVSPLRRLAGGLAPSDPGNGNGAP